MNAVSSFSGKPSERANHRNSDVLASIRLSYRLPVWIRSTLFFFAVACQSWHHQETEFSDKLAS